MNIFIERCIGCCIECVKFRHLQYNLDVEDYDFNFSKKKYSNKLNKTFSLPNPNSQNSTNLIKDFTSNTIKSNDVIIDMSLLQMDYEDFEVIDTDKSE